MIVSALDGPGRQAQSVRRKIRYTRVADFSSCGLLFITILPAHGIDTFNRIAHFLAQVVHESGHMGRVEENLNYSADRLQVVFRKYFKTKAAAQPFHRNPEKIANKVYANRIGNGPPSSGDGYRYRGRGLIQLTGRSNYEKFAQWVGDSAVISDPDLVATKYPVMSAVFFWATKGVNAPADVDDVERVTLLINGGFNGLAGRAKLTRKAKELLNASPNLPSAPAPTPAAALEGATHRVTATALNFRSSPGAPKVQSSNRIGSLGLGKEVINVEGSGIAGWVRIRTLLRGVLREGFVSGKYLKPIPGAAPTSTDTIAAPPAPPTPPPAFKIPPSHMTENRRDIKRTANRGRAYPLGEADRPGRTGDTPAQKAKDLLQIVRYLNSKKPAHKRYQPKSRTTYCNIYAYDYCYLAGVFLPRIWWTGPALRRIRDGDDVSVSYGDTVREMNANMLHDWFEDYGASFGWQNEISLDTLQEAANEGEVCVIVAQRKDLGRSGHIVAVVPENDKARATRNRAGRVLHPVESQAGTKNFRFKVGNSQWWQQDKFRSFGFWRVP